MTLTPTNILSNSGMFFIKNLQWYQ
jgi:hypothetical protein